MSVLESHVNVCAIERRLIAQLRADMRIAAEAVRDALFDDPGNPALVEALHALDASEMIPIEDSIDGLWDEMGYWDEIFWDNCMGAGDNDLAERARMIANDLSIELDRRMADAAVQS